MGPDVGEGTHLDLLPQAALIGLGGVDHAAVPDLAVHDQGVGADLAVLADDGVAPEDGAGQDGGTRADGDPGVDVSTVDVQHPHAGALVEHSDLLLHRLLEPQQLRQRAEGEHHAAHGQHGLPDLLDPAAPGEVGNVPLVVVLRAHRHGRAPGGAGQGFLLKLLIADNKKPQDAFFHPRPHTPVQYGAE